LITDELAHHGFVALPERERMLMLPLATVK
jgi:hypothetical protein